jgi:hypothetical protein
MSDRDEALRQAERKGARAALTRLAYEARNRWGPSHISNYVTTAASIESFRDAHFPERAGRAVVRDGDIEWRLYRDEWKPFVGDTIPYQGEDPTRAAIADMFWAQQRADAEGFVTEGEGCVEAACGVSSAAQLESPSSSESS